MPYWFSIKTSWTSVARQPSKTAAGERVDHAAAIPISVDIVARLYSSFLTLMS